MTLSYEDIPDVGWADGPIAPKCGNGATDSRALPGYRQGWRDAFACIAALDALDDPSVPRDHPSTTQPWNERVSIKDDPE